MSIYKLKITAPDGTVMVMERLAAARFLGISEAWLSQRMTKGEGKAEVKGYSVEGKLRHRRYLVERDGELKSMYAKDVAQLVGIKSNAVSVYAKAGSRVNGYLIKPDTHGDSVKIVFQQAAGFKCFECVYRNDEQACRNHPCNTMKMKGYYILSMEDNTNLITN